MAADVSAPGADMHRTRGREAKRQKLQPRQPPTLEEVRRLPKIELHAHLSGCITQSKLVDMVKKRGDTFTPFDCREVKPGEVIAKCFSYFDSVGKVVVDLDTLKDSTLHVLESFASENCMYVELRTSPKEFKVGDAVFTKVQYLETVGQAIDEFQGSALHKFGNVMEVKLLLSVNRGIVDSVDSALRQLDDIFHVVDHCKVARGLVVGVDICGNPSKLSVVPYLMPALLQRSEQFHLRNLPITFHTAEIPGNDEENDLIINNLSRLNIRRLGHVCFLSDDQRRRVLEHAKCLWSEKPAVGGAGACSEKYFGVELCPTSNLCLMELDSLEKHHFQKWWNMSENCLVSCCTDDTGLFSCDLTSELHDLATAFRLQIEHIVALQRNAVLSSFHPNKDKLLKLLNGA